jgi:hypothetical protein
VTCAKDESGTSKACVACAPGQVNAAGDDKFGADTACTAKPAPVAAASGAATTVVSLTSLLALVFAAWSARTRCNLQPAFASVRKKIGPDAGPTPARL